MLSKTKAGNWNAVGIIDADAAGISERSVTIWVTEACGCWSGSTEGPLLEPTRFLVEAMS